MKNIIAIVIFLCTFIGHAQITLIPDPDFEQALIDLGIDSDGLINGQVLTADIEGVESLDLEQEGIEDLTGIEDFIALESLDCAYNWIENIDLSNNTQLELLRTDGNPLTSLDVTSNLQLKYLLCDHNMLTGLDVTQNTLLEYLSCNNDQIDVGPFNEITDLDLSGNPLLTSLYVGNLGDLGSLDISNNPELIYLSAWNCDLDSIDLSNNPDLERLFLGIGYNVDFNPFRSNNITTLDLTNNPNLERLHIAYTRITSLDLRNGNNSILTTMEALQNPEELDCIQVDDGLAATNGEPPYDNWLVDPWVNYGDDGTCILTIDDVSTISLQIFPNPVQDWLAISVENALPLKEVTIYDLTGRKLLSLTKGLNAIDVSNIASGILIVEIKSGRGEIVKRVVKK